MDAYRSGCGPCEVLWVKKNKPVSSGSQKGPQSVPIRSPEYRDWAVAWIKFRLFSGLTSIKFVCSCNQWLSHTQRSFWPSKLQCGWFMNSSWTFHELFIKRFQNFKFSWKDHDKFMKFCWNFYDFLMKSSWKIQPHHADPAHPIHPEDSWVFAIHSWRTAWTRQILLANDFKSHCSATYWKMNVLAVLLSFWLFSKTKSCFCVGWNYVATKKKIQIEFQTSLRSM